MQADTYVMTCKRIKWRVKNIHLGKHLWNSKKKHFLFKNNFSLPPNNLYKKNNNVTTSLLYKYFHRYFATSSIFFLIRFFLRIEEYIPQAREELQHREMQHKQSQGSRTCSSGAGIWDQVWGATQTWKFLGCSSSHSTSETDQGPFVPGALSLSCCREGQAALGVAVVLV